MKSELEKSRKEIMEKARQDARDILEQSNKVIEKTIREIKESQAEKEKTKSARSTIEQFRQDLIKMAVEEDTKPADKERTKVPGPLKPGDWVIPEGQQNPGIVQRIKSSEAMVDFNGLKMMLPVEKLKRVQKPATKPSGRSSPFLRDLNEKVVNFRLTLDLRGKGADEALQMVQKYLDDAYLLRIKEVSILHGKGEGILRRVIRDYLSGSEEVQSFEDEQLDRGGSGITKVVLK
jgi:DNA mismatch repair protein MutS2